MTEERNNETLDEAVEKLPNGVKLAWGIVKPSSRGPKGELSIAKIVQAAIAIADRDGLAAVSMNRVATSLGFSAMSLYRYVSSKDDLLVLMQDEVCADFIPPEQADGDWRVNLRTYVKMTMSVFLDHPWYGDIPVSGAPLTPNNLRIVDWALRQLRKLPLNDYEKMSFVLLLSSYARAIGMIARDIDQAVRKGANPDSITGSNYTAALKNLVKPDSYPYLYPLVMSGVYTEEHPGDNPVGDDFDFGLERILDGIKSYLERKKDADPAFKE